MKPRLAMTLAHELSHIALVTALTPSSLFKRPLFFPDVSTFQRMDFARNSAEEQAADTRAMELLQKLSLQGQAGQCRLVPEGLTEPRTGAYQPDQGTPWQPYGGGKEHSDGCPAERRSGVGDAARRSDLRLFRWADG